MLSLPPTQRFTYPKSDPKVEKKPSTAPFSAITNDRLTFSGGCMSVPASDGHTSKRHHNHRSSHQKPLNTRLVTNDGRDFNQYWKQQGLQDFQIEQIKAQALKNKPANYIRGSSTSYSPNFEMDLQRSKTSPSPERPSTPHEQGMLALQRERLANGNQHEVQVFLSRIYLYCTHRLRPESFGALRAEVTKYAVPLSPGKEFYRGMLLSASQIRMIIANSRGEEAERLRKLFRIPVQDPPDPMLAKYLMHGFPLGGGKYSHHGITSISTLPNIAAKYANRAYENMNITPRDWDWNRDLGLYDLIQGKAFVPVVVTIVNDQEARAKGFVMEKNYYKAKHEIILDSTNQYALPQNPLSARHGMLQLRINAYNL